MDKQEKIMDGMIKFIEKEVAYPRWKPERLAEVLLRYQMSQGVVVKTDKALPNEVFCEDGSMAWIEPLIKDN